MRKDLLTLLCESPSLLIEAKVQDMLQLLKTFAAPFFQLQAGERCMRAAT